MMDMMDMDGTIYAEPKAQAPIERVMIAYLVPYSLHIVYNLEIRTIVCISPEFRIVRSYI